MYGSQRQLLGCAIFSQRMQGEWATRSGSGADAIPPELRNPNVCVLCRRAWAEIADISPDWKACGYPVDAEHKLAICFRCEQQGSDLVDSRAGNNQTCYYDEIAPALSTSCAFCGTLSRQDRPLYKTVSSPDQGTAQFLGAASTGVGLEVCKECFIEIMRLTYTLLAKSNYEPDRAHACQQLARMGVSSSQLQTGIPTGVFARAKEFFHDISQEPKPNNTFSHLTVIDQQPEPKTLNEIGNQRRSALTDQQTF
jgi:hypothetical protein